MIDSSNSFAGSSDAAEVSVDDASIVRPELDQDAPPPAFIEKYVAIAAEREAAVGTAVDEDAKTAWQRLDAAGRSLFENVGRNVARTIQSVETKQRAAIFAVIAAMRHMQ